MTSLFTDPSSPESEVAVSGVVAKTASARVESESAKPQSQSTKTIKVSETASANDVPVLRRAAMDYLARREHSFYELTQKLGKKFPDTDQELLTEVAEALRSENLQSDDRFTESYVRYRKNRGFAYLHIRADLSSRRVSEEIIDKHLLIDDEHWQLTADQLVLKKLRDQQPFGFGSKAHKKLTRFLESRGFSPIEIRRALQSHLL
jgi:regulatory protein